MKIKEIFLNKKKKLKKLKTEYFIDIKNLLEHEEKEERYCRPVGVNTFWCNSYIEYESTGDRNKILSVEEYLNKSVHI